jgi:hypothetical protein
MMVTGNHLLSSNAVNHKEHLIAAVAECEEVARTRGHSLGRWHQRSKHQRSKSVHASICVVCNKMTWVMQWGGGRHWQCGGQALRQACWRIEGLRLQRKGLPPTN